MVIRRFEIRKLYSELAAMQHSVLSHIIYIYFIYNSISALSGGTYGCINLKKLKQSWHYAVVVNCMLQYQVDDISLLNYVTARIIDHVLRIVYTDIQRFKVQQTDIFYRLNTYHHDLIFRSNEISP